MGNTSKQVLTGRVLLTPHVRLLLLMPPALLLMLPDCCQDRRFGVSFPPLTMFKGDLNFI